MPLLLIAIAVVAVIGAGTYVVTKPAADTALDIQAEAIARPEESTETEIEVVTEPEDEPEPEAVVEVTADADISITTPATEPVAETPAPVVVEEEPTPAPVAATTFANGTYTSDVSYLTPARKSHDMKISLTIENDIVTRANVAYDNAGPSNSHQKRFDSAYQAAVVGVALEAVSPARVGGASLTTNAFNEAVTNIEAQARS